MASVGMCKRCGEGYIDAGTAAQRETWQASHGEHCSRPADPNGLTLSESEIALRVLLAMPAGVPAN